MNDLLMDGLLKQLPFVKVVHQETIELDRSFEQVAASFANELLLNVMGKKRIMKKNITLIAILIALFFMPQNGLAQPKILIDTPVFNFELIPEGVSIAHEFKIKNIGDTLLHINDVLPP